MSSNTFLFQEEAIEFLPGESVLDALLRASKPVSHGCKIGSCQSCLLQSKGEVAPPSKAQAGLNANLVDHHCFLACKCPADAVSLVEPVGTEIIPRLSTTFVSKDMLTRDVMRLRIKVDQEFSYSPGMFVRLITPTGLTRSYSIANSSVSPADYLEFHIRLIPDGKMSTYLAQEDKPSLHVEGPFGSCVYQDSSLDRPLVMIGSGTGLAPLYAVMCDALAQGHNGPMSLYFGGQNIDSLYFVSELASLADTFGNLTITLCTDIEDPNQRTHTGSPLDIAMSEHPSFKGYQVFTCGHPELVKATKRKVFMAGANMGDIFADSFDNQSS